MDYLWVMIPTILLSRLTAHYYSFGFNKLKGLYEYNMKTSNLVLSERVAFVLKQVKHVCRTFSLHFLKPAFKLPTT